MSYVCKVSIKVSRIKNV
jgi:hypothetical protein